MGALVEIDPPSGMLSYLSRFVKLYDDDRTYEVYSIVSKSRTLSIRTHSNGKEIRRRVHVSRVRKVYTEHA